MSILIAHDVGFGLGKYMLLTLIIVLSACSTLSPDQRNQSARQLAAQAGWQAQQITADRFSVLSLHPAPPTQPLDELAVFIEGDGFAWINTYTPSTDPTPYTPLALQLALAETDRTAVYLGRPCQYDPVGTPRRCRVSDWTQARFSAEIVAAMNVAIDRLKQQFKAQRLVLIGYSGGGTIAALLATRRNDVSQVITVAAVLDHAWWTQQKQVSPLVGSLNPADEWSVLKHIAQTHYVGTEDRQTGIRALGPALAQPTAVVQVIEIPGFDHVCCWVQAWPQLVKQHH